MGQDDGDTLDYESELWRQVQASFEPHRLPTDKTAQAALNRIAQKCRKTPEWRPFDEATCTIREQTLEARELAKLTRFHNRKTPAWVCEPIVVLEIDGKLLVIEGNKRVNKWIAERASPPRRAIILAPR